MLHFINKIANFYKKKKKFNINVKKKKKSYPTLVYRFLKKNREAILVCCIHQCKEFFYGKIKKKRFVSVVTTPTHLNLVRHDIEYI